MSTEVNNLMFRLLDIAREQNRQLKNMLDIIQQIREGKTMSRIPRCAECGEELYTDEEQETGLCEYHYLYAEREQTEEREHPDDKDKR